MKNYYKYVIHKHIEHNLPIFFYDHPSSANKETLIWILKYIKEIDIPVSTLSEYATWWKKRNNFTWEPVFDNGNIQIRYKDSALSPYIVVKKSFNNRFAMGY